MNKTIERVLNNKKLRTVAVLTILGGSATGCGLFQGEQKPTPEPVRPTQTPYILTSEPEVIVVTATPKPTATPDVIGTMIAKVDKLATQVSVRQPVTPDLTPTTASATATATRPATTANPTVEAPVACNDGELVFVLKAPEKDTFLRTPVGEEARADIVEIGRLNGTGFGGWDRGIFVIPRLGKVWEVNVHNTSTVAERGFCGTNEAVANWAITSHVPSLQQASRDASGNQPNAGEIGVYRLDFENRAMIVEKQSTLDPNAVLGWIDVSFHENGQMSNVPMHVVSK